MRRSILKAIVVAGLAPALGCGWAQEARYPSKPVRFVVPAAAGGPTDAIARMLAEKMGQAIGQPVLVENRPGASLTLGVAAVAQAAPDGYTLLLATSTAIVQVPLVMKKPPYDVLRDLTTVSHIATTGIALYVNANSQIHNAKDLLDLARSKPASTSYGSYGNGTTAHFLGEVLNRHAGVKMVHVPYKGVAPQLQDLIGGQITTAIGDTGTGAPLIKAGKIRAIAVTGTRRSPALPDVPTFAEQGIPGIEAFSSWIGLFAPAQTPKPVVDLLSAEMVKIVHSPDIQARLLNLGFSATGTNSAQANETTRTEIAKWQTIIRDMPSLTFE